MKGRLVRVALDSSFVFIFSRHVEELFRGLLFGSVQQIFVEILLRGVPDEFVHVGSADVDEPLAGICQEPLFHLLEGASDDVLGGEGAGLRGGADQDSAVDSRIAASVDVRVDFGRVGAHFEDEEAMGLLGMTDVKIVADRHQNQVAGDVALNGEDFDFPVVFSILELVEQALSFLFVHRTSSG